MVNKNSRSCHLWDKSLCGKKLFRRKIVFPSSSFLYTALGLALPRFCLCHSRAFVGHLHYQPPRKKLYKF